MTDYYPNPILLGEKEGEQVLVRGDFTRIKLWSALVAADKPPQTLELVESTGLSYEQVKSWLDAWSKAGYVTKEALGKSPTGGKRFVFAAKEKTTTPPQIDLKGRYLETEHRNYIWEAARHISPGNTPIEVDGILLYIKDKYDIEVDYSYVVAYLHSLYYAGYLEALHKGIRRDPAYLLLHDTGPLAPSIKRGKAVFDGNLGVVVND